MEKSSELFRRNQKVMDDDLVKWIDEIKPVLARRRDKENYPMRHYYNTALDSLDLLANKTVHRELTEATEGE